MRAEGEWHDQPFAGQFKNHFFYERNLEHVKVFIQVRLGDLL